MCHVFYNVLSGLDHTNNDRERFFLKHVSVSFTAIENIEIILELEAKYKDFQQNE